MTTDRLGDRRQLLASFDQFRRDVDNRKQMVGLDKFNEQAFGVITSNHLLNALDLKQKIHGVSPSMRCHGISR